MPSRLTDMTGLQEVYGAMTELQKHVNESGIEKRLLHLLYLVVSRINGCAYCIDMHSQDLRADGESELRIDLVSAWDEVDIYSEREKAAFAWAESLTKVSETHVPDDVFARASQHFSQKELAKLTLAVVTINAWNRFAIGFRSEPGHYRPATQARSKAPAA
jgi:AhpD family alkylhydroperoxidase